MVGWFVCPQDAARPRVAAQDYREHITMMACVSATCRVVPPLFIIKGQSEQCYHDILSKVSGVSVIATSNIIVFLVSVSLSMFLILMWFVSAENAWIDTYSFVQWLTQVFVPCSGATPQSRKLLVLDNHSTRFTFDTILAADQNGVDIFPLPPHASHIMQPLDLSIFGPLKLFLEDYWLSVIIDSEVSLDRVVLTSYHAEGCI